jgi:hypothetical protein
VELDLELPSLDMSVDNNDTRLGKGGSFDFPYEYPATRPLPGYLACTFGTLYKGGFQVGLAHPNILPD